MTSDMMMGERDLEVEVKEKDEIIMSLRLNEHLLKDKVEICRGNMSKLLERITVLENENKQLLKENIFLAKQRSYWKNKCAEWMGVKEENLSLRCVKISEKRFEVVQDPRVQTEYFIYDNENKISRNITDYPFDNEDVCSRIVRLLNEQQTTICKLEQRDYYNQSERYKILGRAIELASDYIHRNDLEYYDFCGLVTELEKELLDNGK